MFSFRVGMQRVSPATATFFGVVAGAVVITGMALALNLEDIKALRPTDFIWFAVLAALAYPIARVLRNTAITWVGASRAAPWASLRPLFALVLGIALLGERPNLPVALGTPIIVCGLLLVVLAEGADNPEEERDAVRRAGYVLAAGAIFCFAIRDVISRHVVGNIVDPAGDGVDGPPARLRHAVRDYSAGRCRQHAPVAGQARGYLRSVRNKPSACGCVAVPSVEPCPGHGGDANQRHCAVWLP